MGLKAVEQYQLSPRVTLKSGDRVRIIGSGGDLGYRLPGEWTIKSVLKRGKRRTYLEVVNYTATKGSGGTYTVLVDGPPYTKFGVRFRPYKVRRIR